MCFLLVSLQSDSSALLLWNWEVPAHALRLRCVSVPGDDKRVLDPVYLLVPARSCNCIPCHSAAMERQTTLVKSGEMKDFLANSLHFDSFEHRGYADFAHGLSCNQKFANDFPSHALSGSKEVVNLIRLCSWSVLFLLCGEPVEVDF